MGNCQAAEVATVLIQYPGGNRVERMHWSVTAQEVMSSNPGHYVALVVTATSDNGKDVSRQLKVLRPAETLAIGYVYQLITFEDVLKELATKKKAKLGKLLEYKKMKKKKKKKKNDNGYGNDKMEKEEDANNNDDDEEEDNEGYQQQRRLGVGRYHGGGGQWKPALQSIAENGTLKLNF